MSVPDFLDTNVLVYAYDVSDKRKQKIAQELLHRALHGEFVISTQVLSEFVVTLLYKIRPAVQVTAVNSILDVIRPITTLVVTDEIVRRGIEAHSRYGVHFCDGTILAAAEAAGSARLLSEDLKHGQQYFTVRVENPFKKE